MKKSNRMLDLLFDKERIDVWEALFLILVTLKLLGAITTPWLIVVLPLFVKVLSILLLMGLVIVAIVVVKGFSWAYGKVTNSGGGE